MTQSITSPGPSPGDAPGAEDFRRVDDYGLLADCNSAALVDRYGSIDWLCVPRFDSPALFCGILEAARGGAFTVAPEDLVESRQYYEPDSGVLVTEMRSRSGMVRVTDALTLRSGADLVEDAPAARGELLRSVRALGGPVRLRIAVEPRGGAVAESRGGGLRLRQEADQVRARAHELVHPGERELVLGLDPDAAEDLHVARLLLRVLEQSRLPDAGLSAQQQHGASLVPCTVQQRVQLTLLSLSAHEHRAAIVTADRGRD
jgi:hypothetical protein